MHGFAYDAIHDEIVVSGPLTQSILVFRGGAKGEEPPIRVIQGPHTQILGTAEGGNDKVSIDPVNNEILLPVGTGVSRENRTPVAPTGVLIFSREANGDVAPKRFLSGPDTQIVAGAYASGAGGGAIFAVAADPVHNRLVVNSGGAMLIFDRTASGNTKPLAVIKGPKSGVGISLLSRSTRQRAGSLAAEWMDPFAPGALPITAMFLPAGEFPCKN